jgi:hypothetical protein
LEIRQNILIFIAIVDINGRTSAGQFVETITVRYWRISMATQQRATAKKAPVKKTSARKTTARKATSKKTADRSFKQSAEKAINIYLGVIGKGIDTIQENVESSRKENDKRMKDLEKRGAKLRKELTKRLDKIEVSDVVEDTKAQFDKIQDQVEDAVDNVKEKLNTAKAA